MARLVSLTTQQQDFIKESYIKEIMSRVKWQHRYGPEIQVQKKSKQKPKTQIDIKLPIIKNSSMMTRQEQQELKDIDQTVNDFERRADMRPVSPKTQSLLYQCRSRDGKGRNEYLRVRNQMKPEEKYFYPLTSNWAYGWQIGNIDKRQSPFFRRCHIVSDTFFRKNGVLLEIHPRDVAS
ncbi:protein SPMIP1 [Pelobates fuscus]|uniref:protein SPMIP1 n=1 Tax=Pelobates fuscus TaxID=191477 RepID=UPI002FE4C013